MGRYTFMDIDILVWRCLGVGLKNCFMPFLRVVLESERVHKAEFGIWIPVPLFSPILAVRYLCCISLPFAHPMLRSQLIPDIIRCYSSEGQTIIFTETKESASQLAELLHGARALNGDIQQAQREVWEIHDISCHVVAAQDLYINDVQLIIQCEPPRDVKANIHRSGRTGSAGNTGVVVMLYDPRRSNIPKIESQVSDSVIPAFKSAAEELLNNSGLSVVDLFAKALAKVVVSLSCNLQGYTDIKKRSLLTSMENYVTLLLENRKPYLYPNKVEAVKGLTITADGNGVVFDVAAEDLDTYLAGKEDASYVRLKVLKELPRLQQRDQSRGVRFGDGSGRGGGSRFSGCGRNGRFSSDRFSNDGGRGRGGNWVGNIW
ncbi:GUCT (NUC152) domain protein [Medicago truncatula]|uniref:RNA helicase n=1 Tax=Medicago truncatula TaxID=3880 RepID=A0A072VPM2_MEDTR|nr:GUCT (NUC152) domain protein [Medicago truncatula]